MEQNQDLWDSFNVEKNILGKEPKWLQEKRKLDLNRNIYNVFWSDEEKALAKLLIAQGKNNHMVAEELGKTDGAVKSFKYRNLISSQNSWTTKEIRYVKQNMKDLSLEEMAFYLNRTIQAVANMKDDLEYDFQDDLPHTWTEEENTFLKQQYGKMKKSQIANQLGVSKKILTAQLKALGIIRKVHTWTDEENEYIKNIINMV